MIFEVKDKIKKEKIMVTFEEISQAIEGKEFDCIKSEGDGFFIAFRTPSPNIGPSVFVHVPNLEEVTITEE